MTDARISQIETDPLTGLPSRRGLLALVGNLSQPQRLIFVFHLKLAHFGVANSLHGADVADIYLCLVAQALRQALPPGALLGRLWGAEFVCVATVNSPVAAIELADRLRRAAAGVPLGGEALAPGLTVSVGVAHKGPELDWPGALTAAAVACDTARAAGTNRVHLYDESGDSVARIRNDLESAMQVRRLIAEESLVLYAQPIVTIEPPHRPVKAEVLLRLKGEDGLALPRALIEGAERFHLMPELDRYVIEHAVQWMARHADALGRLKNVSLNLSGQSISDREFVEFLYHIARFGGVPSAKLCFEITETTAVQSLAHTQELLATLRDLGCRFALDDFGAGACSFAYLRQLKVDEVKIDGQFVRGLGRDPVVTEIVRAIQQVATVAGKQTTAEFIEDQAALLQLHELGVNYGQGWLFKRAMPLDELPAYLEEQGAAAGPS